MIRSIVAAVSLLAAGAAPAQEAIPASPAAPDAPAARAASVTPDAPAASRPTRWAEPIALEGVPNLHRITPQLYRSEQPTALGMRNLEKLGIRTVINLRAFNDDADELRGTALRGVRVPVHTWHLETDEIVQVMRELRRSENGPFLIHCQHGADRTGLMSAVYRLLEQGWSADEALAELVDGGYGFHSMWRNIQRYVRSVDIDALRTAVDGTRAPADSATTAPAAD
jgi:protein tyrosine/serine phosphatase